MTEKKIEINREDKKNDTSQKMPDSEQNFTTVSLPGKDTRTCTYGESTGHFCACAGELKETKTSSFEKLSSFMVRLMKKEKKVCTAYCLGASKLGLLGFHHFYLNRPAWGLAYLLTAGLLGIGWMVDWFRIPTLVNRANKEIKDGTDKIKHLDDAYVLWMPFGLLGFHQFYLKRPLWGLLYALTGGLFIVGWLIDGYSMSILVTDCNKKIEEESQNLPEHQV